VTEYTLDDDGMCRQYRTEHVDCKMRGPSLLFVNGMDGNSQMIQIIEMQNRMVDVSWALYGHFVSSLNEAISCRQLEFFQHAISLLFLPDRARMARHSLHE
jgi:hypothetical protein